MISRKYIVFFGLVAMAAAERAQSGLTNASCVELEAALVGDTCSIYSDAWNIKLDDFKALNPTVDCSKPLVVAKAYCIDDGSSKTTSTPQSGPAPIASPTKPSHPSAMPGLSADCNKWHNITDGDSCDSIISKYGISSDDFAKWNTYVDEGCHNLWLNYDCCVGVSGSSPSTTSQTSNSAKTKPPPHQTPVTDKCKQWYKVVTDDTCDKIENNLGIPDSDFRSWNGFINSDCTNMWLNSYVCVGV